MAARRLQHVDRSIHIRTVIDQGLLNGWDNVRQGGNVKNPVCPFKVGQDRIKFRYVNLLNREPSI
jgi:hypothetical protein